VIVVDASAAVLGLLSDGDARRTLATGAIGVPHLADSEVASALRRQVARGVVTEHAAATALDRWGRLGMRRFAAVGLLSRVWELRDNLSGYDATYVALAEAIDCELLTADARLAAAPGPTCPIVVVRA
jgi:predicted nucleic acid-binding protein